MFVKINYSITQNRTAVIEINSIDDLDRFDEETMVGDDYTEHFDGVLLNNFDVLTHEQEHRLREFYMNNLDILGEDTTFKQFVEKAVF